MIQDCAFYEELMTDDMDGQLSPEHRAILQDHLDQCPDCRQLYEKMAIAHAASELLKKQRTAAVMPAHLPVMIKQRLHKRPAWFGIPVWRYATGLAMVVLLIAVVFVYKNVLPNTQSGAIAGTPGMDAALAGRQDIGDEKESATIQSDLSDQTAFNKSTGVLSVAVATTAAASRSAASSSEIVVTNAPYVLYSGSLTDLKPIRDLLAIPAFTTDGPTLESGSTAMPAIPESFFKDTLPATISSAKILRVLTNSSETVKQVIIMAGFDEASAMQALDQLRLQVNPDQSAVQMETVLPIGHARLADLLGQPLYEQLLPSSMERQLTYLLIIIGG